MGAAAMDGLEKILANFLIPVFMPFISDQRIFLPYLATAVVLAFAVYFWSHRRRTGLEGFWAYCFPRRVFTHPSAKLDYLYFVVNKISFALFFAPVVVGSVTVAGWTEAWLGDSLTPLQTGAEAGLWPTLAFTLCLVLALDLSIFATHTLQHKVPILWEFHKIHHSAEVMTPITVYRMHPVDDFFTGSVAGVMTGLVYGLFAVWYPAGIGEISVLKLNLFLFLFYVFGYNLRHSHIWLAYPGWLSRILVSPAQHQIHHSSEPRHFDRNMGFMFAFWDWIAGTLYVPEGREDFALGLYKGEHREYDSLVKLYLLPFKKVAAKLARKPGGRHA